MTATLNHHDAGHRKFHPSGESPFHRPSVYIVTCKKRIISMQCNYSFDNLIEYHGTANVSTFTEKINQHARLQTPACITGSESSTTHQAAYNQVEGVYTTPGYRVPRQNCPG
eukprot:TRINITY_DN5156_c0_g2_i2.p2 TRINITY_DN5156_c0_g2~~TRINITY_DN5156_c0_g2_i2.p2  ORF type:complete len:112 (+),score=3.90 TRINITY_DN5156_c0_g2_i2:597-932(+)